MGGARRAARSTGRDTSHVLVRARPRAFRAAAAPPRATPRRGESGRGDETTRAGAAPTRREWRAARIHDFSPGGRSPLRPVARFLNRGRRGGFATSTRELALHALAHDGHGRGWRARDRQPAHGRGRGERPRRGQAPRAVGRRQRTARLPRAGFGRRRLGRRHRRFRRLERRRLRRPVVRSRAPRRKRPFPRPREPLVPGNPSPPTPAQIFDPPTTLNGARKHLAPRDPP